MANVLVNAQTNLTGKYKFSYRHETGVDTFLYHLKADGTATYTSEREGEGKEDKIGFWKWNKAKKLIYIELTDSEGTKETHTFAVVRGNLVMRGNSTGWLFGF